MRILTWNVNSVRKRLKHIILLIKKVSPDVICLQETKVENSSFPVKKFTNLGYFHHYLNGIVSFNGVCIISKIKSTASNKINFCQKNDGRHISQMINGIEINNIYIPAGGEIPDKKTNEKFRHKIEFIDELISWTKNKKNSILLGDFNIAPKPDDVWSHKQLINTVSHTEIERKKIDELLIKGDWVDTVRCFVKPPNNLFTWWSYRSPDYKKNNRGRRLDHCWITSDLKHLIKKVQILDYTRAWDVPSDHVPILIDITKN